MQDHPPQGESHQETPPPHTAHNPHAPETQEGFAEPVSNGQHGGNGHPASESSPFDSISASPVENAGEQNPQPPLQEEANPFAQELAPAAEEANPFAQELTPEPTPEHAPQETPAEAQPEPQPEPHVQPEPSHTPTEAQSPIEEEPAAHHHHTPTPTQPAAAEHHPQAHGHYPPPPPWAYGYPPHPSGQEGVDPASYAQPPHGHYPPPPWAYYPPPPSTNGSDATQANGHYPPPPPWAYGYPAQPPHMPPPPQEGGFSSSAASPIEHEEEADKKASDEHPRTYSPDAEEEFEQKGETPEGAPDTPNGSNTQQAGGAFSSRAASPVESQPEPVEANPQAATQPDTPKKKMRLGEKLIEMGLISKDQIDIALQEQKSSKKLIGQILIEMNFITESALAEVLAESAGTERFDPKQTMVDPQAVSMLPKDLALRHKVMPVTFENKRLQLAMADIYNVLAVDQVRRHMPKSTEIVPLYCTESEINDLIDQYYQYEISIDGILKEIETGIRENTNLLDGSQEGYVNPTVRLVNAILVDAIKQGASDIHFEPEGTFLRLRFRVDGQLNQVRSFHRDYWSAIAVRIKIMSGMNIAETRLPQDGRIAFNVSGREVDFRVATQPTVHGENIVMRLLDKTKSLVPLGKLGFSEHNSNLLKKLIKRPEGIIIVTGPTGSGKTTTLYSVLSYINSIDVNIMTLEDPVEYQLPLIRQTYVKEGVMDFSSGIKSLMRQDPDIIFIGEVRDEETAMNSVRAALTGHQVYTTLHTNDALGSIPRLNDIGVPPHMLAGSLICAMAQRLARKLCPSCKREKKADEEECRILGVPGNNPPMIYEAVGCPSCLNKGYKGRTAILEILRIDKEMDELIATGATRRQMLEHALENGFIPMLEDGISKVLSGDIDIKELASQIDVTERL